MMTGEEEGRSIKPWLEGVGRVWIAAEDPTEEEGGDTTGSGSKNSVEAETAAGEGEGAEEEP